MFTWHILRKSITGLTPVFTDYDMSMGLIRQIWAINATLEKVYNGEEWDA